MNARSLHIGLNYVDPNAYDGWDGELSGCINDANDFRGVAAENAFETILLIDEQATSHRVLSELSQAACTLSAGDIFLITYSGHGGQVPDANQDESDQQDETWCLWDRQVVDDELYNMYAQFPAGVRILVISDSCHSGTVAKMALYRKFQQSLSTRSDAGGPGTVTRNMPQELAAKLANRDRAMYDTVQYLSSRSAPDTMRASLILISGCQDNQLSYDGDQNGLFTGTFLQTWNSGAFRGNYTDLHRAIAEQMPPYQTPNLFTAGMELQDFLNQRPLSINSPYADAEQPSQPSTQPPVSQRPTLRYGDRGKDVSDLQSLLANRGYRLNVDGHFGYQTLSTLRAFQRDNGLAADGVAGPAVWRSLEGTAPATPGASDLPGTATQDNNGSGISGQPDSEAWDAGAAPSAAQERPTLRYGDRGSVVEELQGLLRQRGFNVMLDGIFGGTTQSAVRSFQRNHSLLADGIVGQQTWEKLSGGRQRGINGAQRRQKSESYLATAH